MDSSAQVLGGLIKRLANPHPRIIKYVRGAAGADSITGYMITSNAKLKRLEPNCTVATWNEDSPEWFFISSSV